MYSFYISQNGSIDRSGNTLYFTGEGFKRHLPVMNVSEIIITAKVSLSSWAIDYLAKLGIMVHFLNESGRYMSSIIPGGSKERGNMTINQSLTYADKNRRMAIAAEIVQGIKYNILRNMRYYNKAGTLKEKIEAIRPLAPMGDDIEAILGIEGKIWSIYYSVFPQMFGLKGEFHRSYHPPSDPVNSMISYGNALLYSTTLSAILVSGLNPSVSYLHAPSDRSFSLALDIADIFKPVIVERILATLLNNRMMDEDMFERRDGGVYLNEAGRRKFLAAYRDKIESVIHYGNRNISYATVIEQECRNLASHIKGESSYRAFRAED